MLRRSSVSIFQSDLVSTSSAIRLNTSESALLSPVLLRYRLMRQGSGTLCIRWVGAHHVLLWCGVVRCAVLLCCCAVCWSAKV